MFKNKFILALIIIGISAIFIYNFTGGPDFQTKSKSDIEQYKNNLIEMDDSPLKEKNVNRFDFFEPDEKWQVEAKVIKNDSLATFDMLMTDSTYTPSKLYGTLSFSISGKNVNLILFEEENNYLLPFTDLSNNKTTYGGGRYINIPKSDLSNGKLTLDFNKARNFYCAYNEQFVCPIPPKENHITEEVNAGEKNY